MFNVVVLVPSKYTCIFSAVDLCWLKLLYIYTAGIIVNYSKRIWLNAQRKRDWHVYSTISNNLELWQIVHELTVTGHSRLMYVVVVCHMLSIPLDIMCLQYCTSIINSSLIMTTINLKINSYRTNKIYRYSQAWRIEIHFSGRHHVILLHKTKFVDQQCEKKLYFPFYGHYLDV